MTSEVIPLLAPKKMKVPPSRQEEGLAPARAAAQEQREAELPRLLNPTPILEKIKKKTLRRRRFNPFA